MVLRVFSKAVQAVVFGLALGYAIPASATTIDFSGLAAGSSVSDQYEAEGVTIAAVTSMGKSSAASIVSWGGLLTNSPSGGKNPADQYLKISFDEPVYNLSFTFNNLGDNSYARGTSYAVYGPTDESFFTVLGKGSLSTLTDTTLVTVAASGITSLIIDSGFTDTFSRRSQRSWLYGVGAISFDPAPVPLPAALPMFGTALAGLAGFGCRRRKA